MHRAGHVILGTLVLLAGFAAWRMSDARRSTELPFEARSTPPPAAPLCPWREPDQDLKSFFAEATHSKLETHILSGSRVELTEQLGRPPAPDENALHAYGVFRGEVPLGKILTRRVKGAHGAIELVLAVDTNRHVRALHLQRMREPEAIAVLLQSPGWLHAFTGARLRGQELTYTNVPAGSAETQTSAAAVIEGVRSLLVLLGTAEDGPLRGTHSARHH